MPRLQIGIASVMTASLLAAAPSSAATAAGSPATDMIRALEASGPAASLGAEAQVFDRFVGTWDLDGELTAADGTKTALHGLWLFGWVLQGQIMQDLIIEGDLATGGSAARRCGSSKRNPNNGASSGFHLARARSSSCTAAPRATASSSWAPTSTARSCAGRSTTSGPSRSSCAARSRPTAERRGAWSR